LVVNIFGFSCFCWSPKGKQLVVGCEAGTLTQYKPDLKAVKTFSPPNLGSGTVAVVSILWLSSYQFAAIYRDKINTDERPGTI
jgi:nuclear pore complex protein Nup214